MSDVSGLSDLGLNARLTSLVFDCQHWEYSDNGGDCAFYHCGVDGEGYYEQPVVDYCNDWNATMPLAMQYGVGYNPMCGGDYKAFEVYEKYHLIETDCAEEKTLLRTMVTFLIYILERNQHDR